MSAPAALRTRITALLGCDVPVIQAGMGGVARAELAAGVAEGGGFGCLGMVREAPAFIAAEIANLRRRTDRPFGVNLIPAATDPELLAAQLALCIEQDVPVIMGFWTPDRDFIARARDAGRTVVWQVGRPDEAGAAARAGAHALIVQGQEAGGHVRGHLPRHALLSRVRRMVDLPLVAAGGVCEGRTMALAMARGAEGVACGTLFAAARESFAHEHHKRRLVAGRGEDTVLTDVFMRGWPDGAAVRVLRSAVTDALGGRLLGHRSADLPQHIVGVDDGRDIPAFSTHSPLRTTLGDLDDMPIYAGRRVDAIREIRPAGDIVRELAAAAAAELARMPPENETIAPRRGFGFASPPCQMHELDSEWLGFMREDEIVEALNELVRAERAGARVCSRFAADADDAYAEALLRGVAHAESHWVEMLTHHVRRLGGEATGETGDFYAKALRRETLPDRLGFLNRGQKGVVGMLDALIPKVADQTLRRDLEDMREGHTDNIEACDDCLDSAERTG